VDTHTLEPRYPRAPVRGVSRSVWSACLGNSSCPVSRGESCYSLLRGMRILLLVMCGDNITSRYMCPKRGCSPFLQQCSFERYCQLVGGSPELGLLWTPLLPSKKATFVMVLEKRGEYEPVFSLPKMFLHGFDSGVCWFVIFP
jgi:hypothetical protein